MTDEAAKPGHKMFTSMQDAIALVTGGASGIGQACAARLADQGARVVIVDVHSSPGHSSIATKHKNHVEFVVADVTNESQMLSVVEYIRGKYRRLDIVITSAGICEFQPTFNFDNNEPHKLDTFQKILTVNTLGTFNTIRLTAGLIGLNAPDADGLRGVIVIIGSTTGIEAEMGLVAYSASKAAIHSMTLPLAREFASVGIRVVTVAPGLTDTPMFRVNPAAAQEGAKKKWASLAAVPKRLVTAEEVAHMVTAVIENRAVNGEIIRVDGAARNF
ncbi:3-hydroxyacyl-CoA dehydrogenase type-2-like [Paramacrobiotus metropolitanus]|uniref:3-hydroxyacyl-CoA dehydrogenase type-2-like n=1 Tax=Paramacrobiotus metropolitanus TaxID=2943436 RepID=UPI0024458699|nr:3-hydroxyacyl-CoA dehydrogenase type-2-like [Paramacrobiotus metropolitanus]